MGKRKPKESHIGIKQCNRCNEWRSLDDFHKGKGIDGLRQPCRFCRNITGGSTRRYRGPSEITIDGATRYRCCECEAFLPREDFYWRKGGSRGLCRPCGVRKAREHADMEVEVTVKQAAERRAGGFAFGTHHNAKTSPEDLIRTIAVRYRVYVASEKNRIGKRLKRKINSEDKRLQSKHRMAKPTRVVPIDAFLDFVLDRQPFCESCGKPLDTTLGSRDFAIDHFHDTGLLRDLLCNPCNLGIGSLNDDVATLLRAKEYLERHHAKRNMPTLQN